MASLAVAFVVSACAGGERTQPDPVTTPAPPAPATKITLAYAEVAPILSQQPAELPADLKGAPEQREARWPAWVAAHDAAIRRRLDRGDEDIMLETALCKIFCSEMGWRLVNDCVQIMGGESYMAENEIERIFRDSRINLIVEGANEVMQSFIFAYGGKQLAEFLADQKFI